MTLEYRLAVAAMQSCNPEPVDPLGPDAVPPLKKRSQPWNTALASG